MKKILLLAGVAALGFNAVAEEIDITPKAYKFHETNAMCPIAEGAYHGANIQIAPDGQQFGDNIFYNYGFDKEYNNGLMVIGGGQYHNPDNGYAVNCRAGIQLVDLGGEVGSCFAFVYEDNSKVNAALKEATGYDYNITAATTGALNWFNFNFFTDPQNTPTLSSGLIKVRMVYHVYSPKYSLTSTVLNNAHWKTQENGNHVTASAINCGDSFVENPDTEEYEYDPTRWGVYEFVSKCPDGDKESGKSFAPMRLCLNLPGGTEAGSVLFIREITFSQVEGTEADCQDTDTRSYITLKMGEPGKTGLDNVAVAENNFRINGNTVSFSAPATVYNLTGAQVAAGTEVTLSAGVYVARIGEKAVKFVVK